MKQVKFLMKKGLTREDVLETIEESTVNYMKNKRGLDEAGMRKLLDADKEVRASYARKIERAVYRLIEAGVPAKFFGK